MGPLKEKWEYLSARSKQGAWYLFPEAVVKGALVHLSAPLWVYLEKEATSEEVNGVSFYSLITYVETPWCNGHCGRYYKRYSGKQAAEICYAPRVVSAHAVGSSISVWYSKCGLWGQIAWLQILVLTLTSWKSSASFLISLSPSFLICKVAYDHNNSHSIYNIVLLKLMNIWGVCVWSLIKFSMNCPPCFTANTVLMFEIEYSPIKIVIIFSVKCCCFFCALPLLCKFILGLFFGIGSFVNVPRGYRYGKLANSLY